MEERELIGRLERLERSNRRLKLAALGGLALAGLASLAAPAVCKTVTAERLLVHDSSGRTRMKMDAYMTQTPSLSFFDEKGRHAGELSVDAKGAMHVTVVLDGEKHSASLATLLQPRTAADDAKTKVDDDPGVN